MRTRLDIYTFHREGTFYALDNLHNDQEALDCVPYNPGTLKVVNEVTRRIVYDIKRDGVPTVKLP